MDGYLGEYGEGFLGIGYSHPPFDASAGTESHPSTASFDNGSSLYRHGSKNDSQPVFVPAQISEGKNSPMEPQIPYQQQQELESDAGLARSKAKDILRNILHGIDSAETSGSPETSVEPNQANKDTGTFSNSSGNENQQTNNYYGPQEALTNTSHGPSNLAETTQIPSASNSSIESDAQAARVKALDILRKFQSQPNGNSNTIESDAQAARIKAMGILRKFQSQPNGDGNSDSAVTNTQGSSVAIPMSPPTLVSHCGPQDTHNSASDTHGSHLIPQQQNQYHPPQQVPSQLQSPTTPSTIPTTVPIVTTPPWELARRRRECLEKDEERKQRALFKNLQYVARLEEERLAKQLVEVQQVKTLEQQIDERYQQKMEYRTKKRNNMNNGSNNINTSGAGIGTKQRRKAEAKRQKTALPPSLRQNHRGNRGGNNSNGNGKNGSDSVAIYVSNIPTDGSVDEATVQGLFSAYGSLRKIHFYIDKLTGRKKGDALVIYSLSEGEDEKIFTESVCSQVNGCELPGASVLRVEPSDPYHKVTAKKSKSNSWAEKQQQESESSVSGKGEITERVLNDEATGNAAEKQQEDAVGGANEEEDLDDFFASLE